MYKCYWPSIITCLISFEIRTWRLFIRSIWSRCRLVIIVTRSPTRTTGFSVSERIAVPLPRTAWFVAQIRIHVRAAASAIPTVIVPTIRIVSFAITSAASRVRFVVARWPFITWRCSCTGSIKVLRGRKVACISDRRTMMAARGLLSGLIIPFALLFPALPRRMTMSFTGGFRRTFNFLSEFA